jgi:hypothetical protein
MHYSLGQLVGMRIEASDGEIGTISERQVDRMLTGHA